MLALYPVYYLHLAVGEKLRRVEENESSQGDSLEKEPEEEDVHHKTDWNNPKRHLPKIFLRPELEYEEDSQGLCQKDQNDHDGE